MILLSGYWANPSNHGVWLCLLGYVVGSVLGQRDCSLRARMLACLLMGLLCAAMSANPFGGP